MKLHNQTQNKRIRSRYLIVAILVLTTLLVCVGIFLGMGAGQNTQTPVRQTDSALSPGGDEVNSKTPVQNETVDENGNGLSRALSVTFTSIDETPDTVQVRADIDIISNNGTCTLTISKGDKVLRQKSRTQALPNSSTCQGFDIALADLPPGEWSFELEVIVGSKSGEATQLKRVNG